MITFRAQPLGTPTKGHFYGAWQFFWMEVGPTKLWENLVKIVEKLATLQPVEGSNITASTVENVVRCCFPTPSLMDGMAVFMAKAGGYNQAK